MSLSYPEARRAFIDRWTSLIASTEFEGVPVRRPQSRPADTADQFGFNEPARRDFRERYGVDGAGSVRYPGLARSARHYLTALLTELRIALAASASGCRSGVHAATCSVRRSATRRYGATGCDSTSSIVW